MSNDKSDLHEKVTKSERVYAGRFLQIQRDEVITAHGRKSTREFILHPGAALVIAVTDENKILMLEQYRHACGRVFWELPAGKRDAGEDTLVTAQRELKEETGYFTSDIRFLTKIHPCIGYANEFIDIYLAQNLQFVGAELDHDENLRVHKLSVDEIWDLARTGQLTDAKTLSALLWWKNFYVDNK